ncbi:MAG: hypothetical protein IPK68_02920 [Bdellovibrionales bacterium]|nr:hypothetical protein [Bdellovibrionales bacterium]
MAAKIWRNILIILLFPSLVAGAPVGANLLCSDLLARRSFILSHPISSLRENLAALVSRVRPVHKSDRFDVRILSESMRRNIYSPAKLKETTVQEVNGLLDTYENLGFSFRSFLQVLVESHPNAMGQLGLSGAGKIMWTDTAVATPWVGNARELIGIPNLLGRRSLFVGRTDKGGYGDIPRFLVLPAVSSTYHSLQNDFVLAHELAHETENTKSHRDLMWREGRADFLAFAITGKTEVVFPEGIELELVREDGSTYKQKLTVARSLTSPSVADANHIMPHLASYHYNSQIMSSALYEISQKVGMSRAIELVKWMDSLTGDEVIPYLEPKPQGEFEAKKQTEYIDHDNLTLVRESTRDHLSRMGSLFRRWVNQSDLNAEEKATALGILSNKGI